MTPTTIDIPSRIASGSATRKTWMPSGAVAKAAATRMPVSRRSATPHAFGTKVTSELSAESEIAATATSGDSQIAASGLKTGAAPKPTKP